MNECPLTFHTCRFEEELVLYQATTSELSFTSCVLPSLYANELNSGASLRLTRTHLRRISLLRADFRGIVGLSEVSLSNPKSRALNAERMSASGIFLVGTHVEGEVRLLGANISGQLKCSGGTQLNNPKCTALNANGMSVSSVSLRDTHVEGTARLVGANIAGPLVCQQGAKLINRGGHALNAYGVSASSVSLNATHVEGEVRFLGANIGDQLDCSGGTELINPSGHALNAEGCQVGRVLHFSLEEPSVGSVNLAYAQIGTLADNLASWPDTYH